jgi:hypothetical protein
MHVHLDSSFVFSNWVENLNTIDVYPSQSKRANCYMCWVAFDFSTFNKLIREILKIIYNSIQYSPDTNMKLEIVVIHY